MANDDWEQESSFYCFVHRIGPAEMFGLCMCSIFSKAVAYLKLNGIPEILHYDEDQLLCKNDLICIFILRLKEDYF